MASRLSTRSGRRAPPRSRAGRPSGPLPGPPGGRRLQFFTPVNNARRAKGGASCREVGRIQCVGCRSGDHRLSSLFSVTLSLQPRERSWSRSRRCKIRSVWRVRSLAASRRKAASSVWPEREAQSNSVYRHLSWAAGFAPLSRRSRARWEMPFPAAQCRAVYC